VDEKIYCNVIEMLVNTRSLDNQKKEKLNRKQNMRYLSVNKKPAARSYED